jgi:hypothetical protein
LFKEVVAAIVRLVGLGVLFWLIAVGAVVGFYGFMIGWIV